MLVQSEFEKEFRLPTWIAMFAGFVTTSEAVISAFKDDPTPLVDLTLYMVGVMMLFLYAGFQSMKRAAVIPKACMVGMIGTIVTLIPAVFIALGGGFAGWEYMIIPLMPVSYTLSYMTGKEFYVAVLNESVSNPQG